MNIGFIKDAGNAGFKDKARAGQARALNRLPLAARGRIR
jgi:hypothetical protein